MQWPIIPIKNLTFLFPLMFLSKHISLYASGRLKWILDIIWPSNQHFNLKNQRNWIKQVSMLKFWSGIICILLHRPKKLTLVLYALSQLERKTFIFVWTKSENLLTIFVIKIINLANFVYPSLCNWDCLSHILLF